MSVSTGRRTGSLPTLFVLTCALGCASGGPGLDPGQFREGETGKTHQTTATAENSLTGVAAALFRLPEDALGSQRILRLNYQDRQQDGSLKLVLRLDSADRFSVQGSDQFNRSWFRIAVDGDQAVVLDQRAQTYCDYIGAIELDQVPLGPLPFDALPALLLGRLPVVPVAVERDTESDSLVVWQVRDRAGRHWTARSEGDQLTSWTLWDHDEPEVYWQVEGKMSFLSSRRRQLQMRWRSGKVEPLSSPPAGLEPPPDYVRSCPDSDR